MSWIYFFMFCLFGAFNLFVIFIAYEEEAMQLDSLANVDTYWNVELISICPPLFPMSIWLLEILSISSRSL